MKGNPSLCRCLCWESAVSCGVVLVAWLLARMIGEPVTYMGTSPRCLP